MKDFLTSIGGLAAGPLVVGIGLFIIVYTFRLFNVDAQPILAVAVALTPIWLPLVLLFMTYDRWMEFVRSKFRVNNPRVSLRIKLPPEVFRSPEAMESVFAYAHAPISSDTLYQAYIDGKYPLIASYELVSIGGDVRFYINVHRKIKDMVEAQLYAVYPGIEIVEEPVDYAAEVKYDAEKMNLISFHLVKKNDDIFPIKTYIDYKLDTIPKEEEKIEPMATMLEYLGNVKPHERVYIQILAKPHRKQEFKNGEWKKKGTWEADGNKKINEMLQRDDKRQGVAEETENRPVLTMGERDTVGAIERNIGKPAYEVAIRAMYLTTNADRFDATMIGRMLQSFKPYAMGGRNEIAIRWKTDIDYKYFEDRSGARVRARSKNELEQFKRRIYDPGSGPKAAAHQPKVMSAEELATMYHIPGSAIITPNLGRIDSARREAPGNLPIGIPE